MMSAVLCRMHLLRALLTVILSSWTPGGGSVQQRVEASERFTKVILHAKALTKQAPSNDYWCWVFIYVCCSR